jgi:hypothetical protein
LRRDCLIGFLGDHAVAMLGTLQRTCAGHDKRKQLVEVIIRLTKRVYLDFKAPNSGTFFAIFII